MLVYIEEEKMSQIGIREHPWAGSDKDPHANYYDFKEHPELIRTVLEDFVPYEHYDAIQQFYNELEWLNGESSALESNDCFLLGIRDNPDKAHFPFALECRGRLMVFFRRQILNTNGQYISWLIGTIHSLLEKAPKNGWGCVGITTMDVRYKELPASPVEQMGSEVVLEFWAWGNTASETMKSLGHLFSNLFDCLRSVSAAAEKLVPDEAAITSQTE